MKIARSLILIAMLATSAFAGESWQSALSEMPLGTNVTELDRSDCVPLMLNAFQSNGVVKALIFMPGATDEFYFFRRAHATLTNSNPSLLDAVEALTNQTYIEATFQPPLLLLHTTEDALDGFATVKNKSTAAKLRGRLVPDRLIFNDADWGNLRSVLDKKLGVWLRPDPEAPETWHFYRHSFAACGVTQWEMLESIALAGKTTFTLNWLTAKFQPDPRAGVVPKVEKFPMP
ncbi:MAG TPA: hypothetical protein VMV89_09740 [Candidatus Paceibacterota bacterium]|nr:hypothetical protein [Candidatus Paceibacterota bacterium]